MTTSPRHSKSRHLLPLVHGGVRAVLATALLACAAQSAHAADATWNLNGAGNWVDDVNWNPSAPGATSGTTNPNTATFGSIITAARIVTVDANRNIANINFSGNSFAYTLSGGNLLLTSGGSIQTSGAGTAHTDTVSSAISLQGDYSFTAGSSTAARLLSIGGTVTSAATSGTTTLTLNGTNTGNNTVSGVISNGGGSNVVGISKSGAGTWVLSGTNTFTGNVSISGGTLSVGSDANLGTAPGSPTAGKIVLSNGGKLSLTANGTLINSNRSMTLDTGGGTIETTHSNGGQYSGHVTGTGPLTINAAAATSGQFTFGSTTSDYSGGTTIAAGSRIAISVSSTGPAGAPTSGPFGTGTIIMNDAGFRTASSGIARTVANAITLQGNLTRFAGTSNTGNNLTFSGPVTITGASRTLTNNDTNANQLILSGAIGDGGNNYGLTIVSTSSNTVQLSGSNTFTGGVTINSGTLLVGNAGALNSLAGSENAVTFGAASTGRLTLNGNSLTVSNLSTNASAGTPIVQNVNASAATLTVGNASNLSGTYAGVIQNGTGAGALALTKAGTGTLTLSGANTYTGATTVSAGTLLVSGSLSGTSSVSVASGSTLSSGSTGSIATAAAGNIAVTGSLAPGGKTTGSDVGTLSLNLGAGGKLDFASGSVLNFGLGSSSDLVTFSSAGDWLGGDGNLLLTLDVTLSGFSYASTYTIFQNVTTAGYDLAGITGYDSTNYTANFSQVGNDYILAFAPVPEPGITALLLAAGGTLLFLRRRSPRSV